MRYGRDLGDSEMSVLNMQPQFHFSSGVFDGTTVRAVYEAMRSEQDPSRQIFRDILADIPLDVHPAMGGGRIEGIIIIDEWQRLGSARYHIGRYQKLGCETLQLQPAKNVLGCT